MFCRLREDRHYFSQCFWFVIRDIHFVHFLTAWLIGRHHLQPQCPLRTEEQGREGTEEAGHYWRPGLSDDDEYRCRVPVRARVVDGGVVWPLLPKRTVRPYGAPYDQSAAYWPRIAAAQQPQAKGMDEVGGRSCRV